MSTSGAPWVKWWPSDWLAGTRGLSAAETGVYVTLICMMYEAPGGLLAVDDRPRLARLCGVPVQHFNRMFANLVALGKVDVSTDYTGTKATNDRVQKEVAISTSISLARSEAARTRWEAKKAQRNQPESVARASGLHAGLHAADVQTDMQALAGARAGFQMPEEESSSLRSEDNKDIGGEAASSAQNGSHHRTVMNLFDDEPATAPPPQGKRAQEDKEDQQFEEFWLVYPVHRDKARARKTFAKAITRASFETIMEGLGRYVSARPTETWKYAQGWLSGDRWADEYGTDLPTGKETLSFAEAAFILENGGSLGTILDDPGSGPADDVGTVEIFPPSPSQRYRS